jgi:hypothetical protein
MSNHFYKIGGKMYKQTAGGSIGSTLTGETSRVYMLDWDSIFLSKVKKLLIVIDLYKRYVDDITIVMSSIKKGWRFNPNTDTMEHSEDLANSDNDSDEVRTFKILQSIANSISPEIQLTVDTPENHKNKRLPVLDLNIWIQTDSTGTQSIRHSFFKKKVASPYTIMERSAMSSSTKRSTVFQEALRRLRNCDKQSPWLEKAFHLSEWCLMMKVSGYSESFRFNILRGAIKRHEEMLNDEKEGKITAFYRSREQMIQKQLDKGGKASAATWFLRDGVSTTLTTSATPGGVLKDNLQKTVESMRTADGGKTKVIEAGGAPIFLGLTKGDPFRIPGCDFKDPRCIMDPKQPCSVQGACYRIECNLCPDVTAGVTDDPQVRNDVPAGDVTNNVTTDNDADIVNIVSDFTDETNSQDINAAIANNQAVNTAARNLGSAVTITAGSRRVQKTKKTKILKKKKTNSLCSRSNYVGTTGNSAHCRMLQHIDDVRRVNMKNALTKHMVEEHPDKVAEPDFKMTILSTHINNLERYSSEGLYIEKQIGELSINKKAEWGKERGLVRLTASMI